MTKETISFMKICDRFKFTDTIPESVQTVVSASRSRALKATLKKINNYSLWFGIVIFILLKARHFGFKPSLLICKITVGALCFFSAGGAATGTYLTIHHFTQKTPTSETSVIPTNSSAANKSGKKQIFDAEPLNRITLYNGRVYEGVIVSRNETYRIKTAQGLIDIPSAQISLIERIGKDKE
jgi:hypothetical protein